MKLYIALLFITLFLASSVQAATACKVFKSGSYLKRFTRRQSYRVALRRVKRVKATRRVCFNQRYRFKYVQKYRTQVPRVVYLRLKYKSFYWAQVVQRYRCRRRTRRYKTVVYYVNARKRCIKTTRKWKYRFRKVRYTSSCTKKVRLRYRKKVLRPYISTCSRRVKYAVKVRRRRRCSKTKRVRYWTGRYKRNAVNVFCKIWAWKTVRYNTWCVVRAIVWRFRTQKYRCTKRKWVYVWQWRTVTRKYNCAKYRNVRYRFYYNYRYWSTCPYRQRRTRKLAYWYYYTTTCTRKVRLRKWKWAYRRVKRITRVWVIKARTVYQWRWRSATKVVPYFRQVFYVTYVTRTRTVNYYRRFYRYKKVCVTRN